MKKRPVWLVLGLVFFGVAAVLAALLEPTGTVRGLLAGEPFYRGRPLRYWRELLREHGRSGTVPTATSKQFLQAHEALPVLRECARDPDRDVRWPAIAVLAHGSLRTQQVLGMLIEALGDDDAEVRVKAVDALASWGPTARSAIPALTARLTDAEAQVAHQADLAIWRIDASAAADACGWHRFASPEFEFSVMLPAEPEREDRPALNGKATAHSFRGGHRAGPHDAPTCYTVLVLEWPDGLAQAPTEEERFRVMRESLPAFTGGKLVEERKVSVGDLHGREYVLEFEGRGRLQTRQFWIGPRFYAVMVAYVPKFLNAPAAACFLDSFRLVAGEGTTPKRGTERVRP
jgi:hypothetical protein